MDEGDNWHGLEQAVLIMSLAVGCCLQGGEASEKGREGGKYRDNQLASSLARQ